MKALLITLLILIPILSTGQYENFDSFNGVGEWTSPGGNTGSHSGYLCPNLTGNYLNSTTYIFESPELCVEDYTFQISFSVRNNKDYIYIEGKNGTYSTLHTYTGFGSGTVSNTFVGSQLRVRFVTGSTGSLNGKYLHMDYFDINCNVLPVELIEFNYKINKGVYLYWVVNEVNTDKYLLERSTDAFNYQIVSSINSKNKGTQTLLYEFEDVNYENNKVNYYRLTEVDLDGVETVVGLVACYMDIKEIITYHDLTGREIKEPEGLCIKRTDRNGVINYEKIIK